jgi:hypothetical protein
METYIRKGAPRTLGDGISLRTGHERTSRG